ncbi:MAG: EMC3/TMCO1 family protein [Nanoarchaeota archaeon]
MAIQEIITANPKASIIIISFIVSLFITIVNYFVMDREKMQSSKDRQKLLQAEMKKHRDNPQKMMEIQKELFAHTGEMMKHSFKPMLITFIPIIFIFSLIRGWYADTSLGGSWFWWYFGASIAGSIIFRKLFKMP